MKEDTVQKNGGGSGESGASRLVDLCREMIGYLDTVEESDSGREFHPTTINTCRCMVADRLSQIIPEIKSICDKEKE